MRSAISRVLVCALVFSTIAIPLTLPFTPRVSAQGPCTTRGDNLTRNGSVTEGGYDTPHGVVANSWNAFLINGGWPEYDLADHESANGDIGGSSSQYIHGDGSRFDAGIYQVITNLQPGASYEFSVGWAAMLRDTGGGNNTKVDDQVIRRVGVDPYGGTDPQSPNMKWGPEVGTGSSGRSLNHPDMRITFQAMSNQVTVFLRVYNLSSSASDKVFFDVMCLLPRGDIPTVQIEPTATPTLPATATSEIPPTNRPPTRVPSTATPEPPTATLEPARVLTATPELVAKNRVTATPEARPFIPTIVGSTDGGGGDAGSGGSLSIVMVVGAVGIIGISLLGMVLIGGFAVWRIFMRQVDDALDPPYYPDDQAHFQ
ncbi:MAG: hypothetical protein HY741_17620 [Chloroflexi bacterium]|nr:hypothetical protein [Chloroflexota bacterium]